MGSGTSTYSGPECYFFADCFLYALDHTGPNDLWYQGRHGTKNDMMNMAFNDGHSEPIAEDDLISYQPDYSDLGLRYGYDPPWWVGTTR